MFRFASSDKFSRKFVYYGLLFNNPYATVIAEFNNKLPFPSHICSLLEEGSISVSIY